MINIDFKNSTYECPFCKRQQAFSLDNSCKTRNAYATRWVHRESIRHSDINVYHIMCNNKKCNQITVVAVDSDVTKQWDLIPENVYREFPDYIPVQIRNDYTEACMIIDKSPKAAATLLRRCLQGMIHDFWEIKEKNLNAEITSLKDKVSSTQWKALDGLRKLGNIGAHMEEDVNLIIDINPEEAIKLKKVIELLLEKWYITRYEEEQLFKEVTDISDEKEKERQQIN